MRIIKRATLAAYWRRNAQARSGLLHWHRRAKEGRWRDLQDLRKTFPHADVVKVASGRSVTVFNIAGNRHRLITATHYNRQMLFTLMVLTHAEYSRGDWKDVL